MHHGHGIELWLRKLIYSIMIIYIYDVYFTYVIAFILYYINVFFGKLVIGKTDSNFQRNFPTHELFGGTYERIGQVTWWCPRFTFSTVTNLGMSIWGCVNLCVCVYLRCANLSLCNSVFCKFGSGVNVENVNLGQHQATCPIRS